MKCKQLYSDLDMVETLFDKLVFHDRKFHVSPFALLHRAPSQSHLQDWARMSNTAIKNCTKYQHMLILLIDLGFFPHLFTGLQSSKDL